MILPLSVILPTYNRVHLLKEALDSVFSQTAQASQIIVADDGSNDGTLDLLSTYSQKHPRLQVCKLAHSGFPGRVRNSGVELAQYDWLAFLDSDDLWQADKLEKQWSHLPRFLGHTREVWLRGEKILSQKGQKHLRDGNIFEDCLKKCIIGPSTVLMRKDVFHEFGGFREDLEVAEDYEFWLRICSKHPMDYLDLPLTVKRDGSWPQLSRKYGYIEGFRLNALYDLVENSFFKGEYLDIAVEELIRKAQIWVLGAEKRQNSDEAKLWQTRIDRWINAV